jgi:hypothetical protein
MKLMRVASMALAAYLVNSALLTSITRVRSWLRLKGRYRRRMVARARWPGSSVSTPRTMRSGRMKSSTAAPSFRNSGLLTTEKLASTPRRVISSCSTAATFWPVPTGTVDLSTTTLKPSMCWPMLRAAASTYCRSALPSSPGGVPTAMNSTSPWATAAATSVVNSMRPASTLASIRPFSPGS